MKKEHLPSLLIFSGFCLLLFLPLIGLTSNTLFKTGLTKEEFIKQENRVPAPCPELFRSWGKICILPAKVEAFFNDRYAFRSILIKSYSWLAWYVLKKPLNANDCLIGQNNYLFLADNYEQVFSQHSGAIPVSEEDLAQAEAHQAKLKAWCTQRNITYLCVVPPDKHSIYPEYLPKWVKSPRKSLFIDELSNRIKDKELILNLKPGLLKAKSLYRDHLYPRWDTHWNGLAAYEGYKILMQHLSLLKQTPLKIVESPQFSRNETNVGADLSAMSKTKGFISDFYITPIVNTRPEDLKAFTFYGAPITPLPIHIQHTDNIIVENKKALNKGTLVIVRDSFSSVLSPFLYSSFEKTVFIGHDIIPDELGAWLDETRPDYFICEQVERNTPRKLPIILKNILLQKCSKKDILNYIQTHSDKVRSLSLNCPSLFPAVYCTLLSQGTDLVVHSDKNDFYIELVAFEKDLSPRKGLILQIELTPPQETSSQIFYQTNAEPNYDEQKSERRNTTAGRQILNFYLQDSSEITKIRFDPGERPGDYRIHSLKICPVDDEKQP